MALEMSVEKNSGEGWGCINQFQSRKTSLLIAMQLQAYYKHIFGPSTPSVKYHSQTHIITNAMLKQSSIAS